MNFVTDFDAWMLISLPEMKTRSIVLACHVRAVYQNPFDPKTTCGQWRLLTQTRILL
jgi:hypothetical protein